MKNLLSILFLLWIMQFAQSQTVGLISTSDNVAAGYTLFAPSGSTTTYLIDNDGLLIQKWQSTLAPGNSVYLLEDGTLLRAEMARNQKFSGGGTGGRVKKISWDGKTEWQYDYSNTAHCQHHDVEYMPNGNVLLIAWEVKSRTEAIAAGRKSTLLSQNEVWPDHIIEVKPTGDTSGQIVWEWHAWDHIIQDYDAGKENYGVVAEHPELIDVNYVENGQNNGSADWMHINAVAYNAELDQIMLSVHNLSEVWIIDHSTTTEEAAGHSGGRYGKGGDLLYRFGNPQAYNNGSAADRILFGQHNAHWIPEGFPGTGHVLVFNNGASGTTHNYSSVDEFILPIDESGNYEVDENGLFITPIPHWSYSAPKPSDFYATNISGAQRLANGNTLICNGPSGKFFEVDADKNRVWEYINPVTSSGILPQGAVVGGGRETKSNNVFRCTRYAPDYSAFDGKDLTPGSPIELYPTIVSDTIVPTNFSLGNYPNPFNPKTTITFSLPERAHVKLTIYNVLGMRVETLVDEWRGAGDYSVVWDTAGKNENISSGTFLYQMEIRSQNTDYVDIKQMTLLK